jgi:hypothetical protein
MNGNKEERVYRLIQTVVRRVREADNASGKRGVRKSTKRASH